MNKYKPFSFLILSLIISWSFWIPAAFTGLDAFSIPIIFLLFLGGLGPLISSLLLTYITFKRDGLIDLWKRLIQLKRIKKLHYGIIFIVIPGICVLAMTFESIFLKTGFQFEYTLELLFSPFSLIYLIVFNFFFGPLPEEIGWRGYGLDSLQEKLNPGFSTLILGITWSIWHVPLFFMKGTYQSELELWSLGFWIFFATPVVLSFLMTWIYNNSNRSILSAVLFHFMVNFSGQFFQPSLIAELFRLIILTVFTISVIIISNQNMKIPNE